MSAGPPQWGPQPGGPPQWGPQPPHGSPPPQWGPPPPQGGAPRHGGPQPTPGPRHRGGSIGGIPALLGGLLAIGGTFLPWVTISAGPFGTLSVDGFDARNYGALTLVAGVVLAGLGAALFAVPFRVAVRAASGGVGLVVAVLAVVFMIEVRNQLDDAPLVHALLTSSTGAGPYVVLAGGVLGIASAFLPRRRT